MAFVLKDRVQETTTTTGTGTITLAGAVQGYQSFSAIGNGNNTYYTIAGGTQWEVGIGTYTSSGTTLSRDTVLSSSNSGSLVNFSLGEKLVFVTYPSKAVDPVISDTAPTSPTVPLVNGIQWYDSSSGEMKTYYNGAWVPVFDALPGSIDYDFSGGTSSTTFYLYILDCGAST